MSGALVADLAINPRAWLFLSLLSCVTIYFKYTRFWSVRNLDLLLLFALAPGLLQLIGRTDRPWTPFVLLFLGSALWLARCLLDLGLTRRPLLEPNLNAAGLACLAAGMLGLMVAETVALPVRDEAGRNPADTHAPTGAGELPGSADVRANVGPMLHNAPLPARLKAEPVQVILSRVLASLAHLGLFFALLGVGWRHFERPISGLAASTCYLLLPYTRIALVDSGQLLPAALIVTALLIYHRPTAAGVLIGLAAGWMPACLGLLPLWISFYRRRGAWRFALAGVVTVAACVVAGQFVPGLGRWAWALGARSVDEVGLVPGLQAPNTLSVWSGIDPSYRLPVQILYLAFVLVVAFWPADKNLGELIALSAAVLVASQFWYLEKGGTLILLYLPLILLMMFRPNLGSKRPRLLTRPARERRGAFVAD